MPTVALWIIGVLIAGGGLWFVVAPKADTPAPVAPAGESMQKDAAMEAAAMMEKDTVAMGEHEGSMMAKPDAMQKDGAAMKGEKTAMMAKAGSYQAYAPEKLAMAAEGKVVLFFRASWCPSCRTLDADIRAHLEGIPAGVTILDVDYDTATALKQKYGVTYQHTLVQVDAQGNQLAKWSGSASLADIVKKII